MLVEMTLNEYLLELKKYSQYDFSEYSQNSIHRRLTKILEDQGITIEQLLEKTKRSPFFVEQLVNEITVNTTDFFRDPNIWVEYATTCLDQLKDKKSINIWHAASSSGQEVYSNLFLLEAYGFLDKCHVLATDINKAVIEESKKGVFRYSTNIKSIDDFKHEIDRSILTDHLLKRLDFSKGYTINNQTDTLTLNQSLIDKPKFLRHDLVSSEMPIEMKFDVIFCRNVLIYFNSSLQSKTLNLFHNHLNSGGVLILGSHEGVSGFFKTKFKKHGSFFVKSNVFQFKY